MKSNGADKTTVLSLDGSVKTVDTGTLTGSTFTPEIKQPKGGYIKPSQFTTRQLKINQPLNLNENLHSSIMGLTVDYLTRFILGSKIEKAFEISIKGAYFAREINNKNAFKELNGYLNGIKGLDNDSIINACKCTTFDVWYRNTAIASRSKTAADTNPDEDTIENIKIMVERSLNFFKEYGPILVDGFTFEPTGYTSIVNSGDGDFLTDDTLWDFKVSKNKPTSKHTLQLLMYWIMGQHSRKTEFKNITKLGIFNPRLNTVYTLNIADISTDIIQIVEKEVICY